METAHGVWAAEDWKTNIRVATHLVWSLEPPIDLNLLVDESRLWPCCSWDGEARFLELAVKLLFVSMADGPMAAGC